MSKKARRTKRISEDTKLVLTIKEWDKAIQLVPFMHEGKYFVMDPKHWKPAPVTSMDLDTPLMFVGWYEGKEVWVETFKREEDEDINVDWSVLQQQLDLMV